MMTRPERAEDVWAGHFVHRLGSASQDRSTAPSASSTRCAGAIRTGNIIFWSSLALGLLSKSRPTRRLGK